MTPMQHRAVLVCILCVLAVLLTFGITTTLLKKEEPAPSVSESVADPTPGEDLSGHYQIDNASTALLTETADAGTDYLNDTLFLGDSNTVRLYKTDLSVAAGSKVELTYNKLNSDDSKLQLGLIFADDT